LKRQDKPQLPKRIGFARRVEHLVQSMPRRDQIDTARHEEHREDLHDMVQGLFTALNPFNERSFLESKNIKNIEALLANFCRK
jgi:hypothetical protein